MKERGGGNGSDRSRWAGDGLLEIWGAQSCWLIWSVCSFLGRRRSAQVQVQAQAQAHRTTCTHIRSLLHFCTGLFWPTKSRLFSNSLPRYPAPTAKDSKQAGPGREGNVVWELAGSHSFVSLYQLCASSPGCPRLGTD